MVKQSHILKSPARFRAVNQRCRLISQKDIVTWLDVSHFFLFTPPNIEKESGDREGFVNEGVSESVILVKDIL